MQFRPSKRPDDLVHNVENGKRTCNRCHETKTTSEFYRHPTKKDGLFKQCKACTRAARRERYIRLDGAKQARDYRATDSGRRVNNETQKRMKRLYPQKWKARTAIRRAVKAGRLTKLTCKRCGDPKTQAHHPDYSKPLDIVWVCQTYHREIEHRSENPR